MCVGARLVTALIYTIRWEQLWDSADFHVAVYHFDDDINRMALDREGNVLAVTDLSSFTTVEEITRECKVALPNPLKFYPSSEGASGKLTPGSEMEVNVRAALKVLQSDDFDATPNLYQFLAFLDDVFIVLGSDHKGTRYEHSKFGYQMYELRMALMGARALSTVFTDSSERSTFVRDAENALQYLRTKITVLSKESH